MERDLLSQSGVTRSSALWTSLVVAGLALIVAAVVV